MKTIELSKGMAALVDDADFEKLNRVKWTYNGGYASRLVGGRKSRTVVLMHRVILSAKDGLDVDHIDGNGLNNQKSNLRLCSRSENQMNRRSKSGTSIYKGVSFYKRDNNWQSSIRANGKNLYLGRFKTEKDAASAYNKAAIFYFKDFARLNVIIGG